MRENVARNLELWDDAYDWPQNGDEWQGQADLCGVSYETWKRSLVEHLIAPHVDVHTRVLEIGPGRGRWTEYLVRSAAHVTLVDISAACLDYCRRRFGDRHNVDYFLTTGEVLPLHAQGRVDFVWSYDAFVHMDPEVVRAYLREVHRVLRDGGRAIIHHANVADLSAHRQDDAPGWRSAMTSGLMRELAEAAGLAVISQCTYWDAERRIGTPRFGDQVTHLRRGDLG
jgi:ubiquinone/menaquinone biosynthesis C-methylase UbiE